VPKGTLEVVEYMPRQAAMADAVPPDQPSKFEDFCSRLRLEHRTLTSCAAALAVATLHVLLVAPVLWGGGASHRAENRYRGEAALQWVVLNDSSGSTAISPSAIPPLSLSAVGVADALPKVPAIASPTTTSHTGSDQSDDPSGLGTMYGRYVGQIRARIDRAWQRPRTAIGAPIFRCLVQIEQDLLGRIEDVTLVQCNGDARWRLSLVHAIESASPLPAPPSPGVFAQHVLLDFRAMAYSPGAQAGLYESEPAPRAKPGDSDAQSQNAFQTLRNAVRAPDSRRVVELRIEGSKAEVEPERQ
jgi:hypothetical protein